jgi:hypothetical protein
VIGGAMRSTRSSSTFADAGNIMIFEVAEILSRLAKKRPIFHSEADFQHALAWEVRGMHVDADI